MHLNIKINTPKISGLESNYHPGDESHSAVDQPGPQHPMGGKKNCLNTPSLQLHSGMFNAAIRNE
jgi:hypothetical protein